MQKTVEQTNDSPMDKFILKFFSLAKCSIAEQKQKINEINELINEMDDEELRTTFFKVIFDSVGRMLEEKKLSLENALLLLKHYGWRKLSKAVWNSSFCDSLLLDMFEKMIIDEEKKKEEKNEKLLTDLCECYLALLERKHFVPDDVLKIVVHYILRAASNKEESEEVQKEVEMALLPLSNIFPYTVEKEEHEKELIEILLHHRQHHNLTHLAYQSALILLKGCMTGRNLRQKKYELEFDIVIEATKELTELGRCLCCREEEKKEKEINEEFVIKRWIEKFDKYIYSKNFKRAVEFDEFISCLVNIYRAANDNCRELHLKVMDLFQTMAISTIVSIDDMLKGGAIDCILEYMTKSTLDDEFVDSHVKTFLYIWERMIAGSFFLEKNNILCLLSSLSYKSKEIMNKGNDLAKRKIPFREMLEKLEEEGLEDIFIGFYGMNRIKDPDGDF